MSERCWGLGGRSVGTADETTKTPCALCGRKERYPINRREVEALFDESIYETGSDRIVSLCLSCAEKTHAAVDGCRCFENDVEPEQGE